MSTKCSIIWNRTNDYYFHIYDDWDKEFYFLEIEGQIMKVKKNIIAKLVRDLKNGDIEFAGIYSEKKTHRKSSLHRERSKAYSK